MRVAIGLTGTGEAIGGMAGGVAYLRDLTAGRVANGEAFAGEHAVRLPRRFTRRIRGHRAYGWLASCLGRGDWISAYLAAEVGG